MGWMRPFFCFWSKRQVERIIRNLVANGALLEGNFNTLPYDRTKWYALGDEVTAHYQNVDMDFTERGNDISPNREMTYHETVTPIPDHTPDSKPDKKHIHAQFDCFWQAYPKKRAKEEARKAFFKLAPEEKLFGPCGVGWKYEIVRFWSEDGAGGEKAAFAEIRLYIKQGDTWSDAIPGIGGSALVSKEKNGMYTSDECYKMALTDAISVSCKALGVGADIYWDKDTTKYAKKDDAERASQKSKSLICPVCGKPVKTQMTPSRTWTPQELMDRYGMCSECVKRKHHEKQTG